MFGNITISFIYQYFMYIYTNFLPLMNRITHFCYQIQMPVDTLIGTTIEAYPLYVTNNQKQTCIAIFRACYYTKFHNV